MSKRGPTDESTIRYMGLEGLIIILRSLVKSGGTLLETTRATSDSNFSSPSKRPTMASAASARGSTLLDESDLLAEEEELSTISLSGKYSGSMEGVGGGEGAGKEGEQLVQSYDRKQKIQEEIETGLLKFNQSAKKGLAYLASHGHLEHTPQGVANFFRQYADKLDKTAIGDYLGREVHYEGGFCVRVLHEYVDMMDFTDMHFDEAIRLFLSGFRLPGEAQKIDRMMEKFAERYYIQNRDVFASADMAFILAFSTIMLQTNLHNPAIRDDKRMTKDQFIKQNKGISSDGELPESMLCDIYDRIQANPISLNTDEKQKKQMKKEDVSFSVFNDERKRKKDAFNDERKEMVRMSEAIFKQKLKSKTVNRSVFVRSARSDSAYVRPMFEVAWAPMIGVLSQTLEMAEDADVIALCLEGMQLAIRIACRMDVSTARDTFVNSLARFTTLETVKEMRQKHVDGIKMLISVALSDGDYMMESWGQILRCISQLSRLQLFGNGLHSDDMFFSDSGNDRSGKRKTVASGGVAPANNMDPFTKLFSGPTRAETSRLIEETNAELLMREIDPVFIDRIFLSSQLMSTESVTHFVNNLCAVSVEEISTTNTMGKGNSMMSVDMSSTPRVFSLQKLVEVADFNMTVRPRIAWTKLWSVLAMHFTTVGVHGNHALAMYAIDSLKQLSIKFLQKAELSNFNFQRLFLKPFEIIMNRATSTEIHELILRCLDIMILACANNIRSGWRSIFSVFSVAAGHEKQDISGIAFEITERLMTQQFDLLIFDFVELMNCLVAFVAGSHSLISLSALARLSQCADHLAQGTIEPALHAQHSSSDAMGISWEKSKMTQIGEDEDVFRLWWPLLLGLSTRVSDSRLVIRTRAIETLHRVLRTYGELFSSQTWEVIFKGVLFPMVDSAKTDDTPQPQSCWPTHNPTQSKDAASWIATSAATVLSVCLSLFNQHYNAGLTAPLLSEMIGMLEGCISQDIESLSRMGLSALKELITTIPVDTETKTLAPEVATLICSRFSKLGLNNLRLDLGDSGMLLLDSSVPAAVRQMMSNREDKGREGVKSQALELQTPFGVGKVVDTVCSDYVSCHDIMSCHAMPCRVLSFYDYSSVAERRRYGEAHSEVVVGRCPQHLREVPSCGGPHRGEVDAGSPADQGAGLDPAELSSDDIHGAFPGLHPGDGRLAALALRLLDHGPLARALGHIAVHFRSCALPQ
jgi:brefeldin A-inhibited guanine nucleotide-exchange protein